MKNFFNKELLYRITSVFIFIPIAILPLLYSNYISIFIYLMIASIILLEIIEMKERVKNIYNFNLYIIVSQISFFFFLLLLVTEKMTTFELLIVIVTIWGFDTFSYLGGKIVGGPKLIPNISKGKTISGLVSGIFMTIFFTELMFIFIGINHKLTIAITLIIIILSFTGDMTVSFLKRKAAIKDAGNIMPGHGGLLDRFDSFILVFFFIGIFNIFI